MVVLSLNQSALYFGTAAGAALGALIASHGPVVNIAWMAAAFQFAALAMLGVARWRAERAGTLRLQPAE